MNTPNIDLLAFVQQARNSAEVPDRSPDILPGLMAICRKIDVGGRLFAHYDTNWHNLQNCPLLEAQDLIPVADALLSIQKTCERREIQLKLLNTLLKLCDIIRASDTTSNSSLIPIENALQSQLEDLLK